MMLSSWNHPNRFLITDQYAVITGGAGLLGVQHAIALLNIGGNVILWDIQEDKLKSIQKDLSIRFPQRDILIDRIDISDEPQIETAIRNLSSKNIQISILINNAALNPNYDQIMKTQSASRLENFSFEQWNQELQVGLTGAFLVSKHIGQEMAKQNKGVILNIASDLSVIAPDQRLYRTEELENLNQPVKPVTYSVIKSGLIGLTRYLATYWNEQGIRSNSLSPGGVYYQQEERFINKIQQLIPLGRMARVDEYQSVVQFLCSDASSYMTGQNIIVDGGRSIW